MDSNKEVIPAPKTCFNCGTQTANYYQKWRQMGTVCHKCYMRLFRAEKKNESATRDCSDQSMSESGCETYFTVDDQNNNNNNGHNGTTESVMHNTFPISSSDNLATDLDNPNEILQRKDSKSSAKNIKPRNNNNMLPPGLMPPSHIDTSIFKKPATQQEAQANMIKSLNAAHYYAGYYEAMKQLKK